MGKGMIDIWDTVRLDKDALLWGVSQSEFPTTFQSNRHGKDATFYLCVRKNAEIVGVATLFDGTHNLNIDMVETAQSYRNQGVGRKMIAALFDYADEVGMPLTTDGFTKEGGQFLLRELKREKESGRGREIIGYSSC